MKTFNLHCFFVQLWNSIEVSGRRFYVDNLVFVHPNLYFNFIPNIHFLYIT